MKYRLKKDLPWAKAGTLWEKRYDPYPKKHFMQILTEDGFLGATTHTFPQDTFSDWFEEVDERWKPKLDSDERYFYVNDDGTLEDCIYSYYSVNDSRYTFGNFFRTKDLARKAAEEIKALLKEFHKNNP